MSLEDAIQFLTDSAAEQEAKLEKLERNSALLEEALRRLAERQKLLEIWAAGVQAALDDLEERRFTRRKKARSPAHAKPEGPRKDAFIPCGKCSPARRPPRKR